MTTSGAGSSSTGGFRRWCVRHPLIVVLIGASLVAIGQGIWIWTHRRAGAFDPDEAGYIATALRFHRLFGSDPLELPRAIGGSGFAPLVPIASVPLLWLGPDDPRTVMLVLPVLMVVTSVAIAGISHRLTGPRTAIVSGLVFGSLPTVIFATQTYWFGLGAAAALCLALWALLASDRLTNPWAYAYGAGIAAMLLSRTMTLGYLPAALMAGVVMAGRSKQSWIGLAKAVAALLLIAGPWYAVGRDSVFSYLFSYGYGERAGFFGSGGPIVRLRTRITRIDEGLGIAGAVFVVALLVALGFELWRWYQARRSDASGSAGAPWVWPSSTRGVVAVGSTVVVGFAALVSTTNAGVWFELPLVAVLIPLGVALCSRLPWPIVTIALVPVALVAVIQLAVSWWLISPAVGHLPTISVAQRSTQYEPGFRLYDPRFDRSRRSEQAEAAAEWAQLSSRVERRLHEITGGERDHITLSGNFQLFNVNSVQLAAERNGWTPRLVVPDTVTTPEGRAKDLSPRAEGRGAGSTVERILVIADHDQHLFVPDAQVQDFYREALEAGWRITDRFDIPLGGEVLILRHAET